MPAQYTLSVKKWALRLRSGEPCAWVKAELLQQPQFMTHSRYDDWRSEEVHNEPPLDKYPDLGSVYMRDGMIRIFYNGAADPRLVR